eukprot:jgi/Hompol1/6984/HPOL_005147-RA
MMSSDEVPDIKPLVVTDEDAAKAEEASSNNIFTVAGAISTAAQASACPAQDAVQQQLLLLLPVSSVGAALQTWTLTATLLPNLQIKRAANELFASKKFDEAITQYTLAISYNPTVAAYYANRAFAYIRTELYGAAVNDASDAIKIDPNYVKAYYRRACGLMALGQLKAAVKDLRAVVQATPQDKDARSKLTDCEKELQRRAFEKAIASDDTVVSVVTNYDGPHLPESGITLEFVKEMLEYMKAQKCLHRKYTLQIMVAVKALFEKDPPIVDIEIPADGKITVCGDIHGQFYDMLHVFEENGLPSNTNMYLWNGDFVDRGAFSVECILALFAFKLLYPKGLYLSRGNHETFEMNRTYGFQNEVKDKYNELVFKFFSEIFDAIPIGNLIANKILVVHGGLFSRDGVTMDDLRKIDRFRQPGSEGLMCELLWSDPQPFPGRSPSQRGVGIRFGPDVTAKFLEQNNLDLLIRSHEVKANGYEIAHNGKCITVFSAPNYCDASGNLGAYIHITPDLQLKYNQFSAVP